MHSSIPSLVPLSPLTQHAGILYFFMWRVLIQLNKSSVGELGPELGFLSLDLCLNSVTTMRDELKRANPAKKWVKLVHPKKMSRTRWVCFFNSNLSSARRLTNSEIIPLTWFTFHFEQTRVQTQPKFCFRFELYCCRTLYIYDWLITFGGSLNDNFILVHLLYVQIYICLFSKLSLLSSNSFKRFV